MLKTRVLTAVILVLIFLGALFGLPPAGFAGLMAAVVLGVGGWEAARLAGLESWALQTLWISFLVALGVGCIYLLHHPAGPPVLFGLAVATWLLLLAWLGNFELGRAGATGFQPAKLLVGVAVLVPAFAALAWLQFHSPWLVIGLIGIIAAADTGAYFTGRAVGGPKLAPRISPGKTRAGALGGLAAGGLAAMIGAGFAPEDSVLVPVWSAAAAGVVLAAVSIGGDLLVSLLKRHRRLKDTSRLLPGHGGLLDRIDSLCAALPLFALLAWLGME